LRTLLKYGPENDCILNDRPSSTSVKTSTSGARASGVHCLETIKSVTRCQRLASSKHRSLVNKRVQYNEDMKIGLLLN